MTARRRLARLYRLRLCGERYLEPSVAADTVSGSAPSIISAGDLSALASAVSTCHLCDLAKTRKHTVFGSGNPHARIMFVGEGPGESEDEQGLPFVGRSGELLTKMIEGVFGIPRSEVYIANAVKCRPPMNRTPAPEEIAMCSPYLFAQIDAIRPLLIVTLGGVALQTLMEDARSVSRERGKIHSFRGIPLVATYHPSYLLRNPSAKKEAFADLLLAKSLL